MRTVLSVLVGVWVSAPLAVLAAVYGSAAYRRGGDWFLGGFAGVFVVAAVFAFVVVARGVKGGRRAA